MNIQADHYITGDPAFAVDRHGSIVLWNDAAEQTFGYPHAEALGKKCWELMCGHDVNDNLRRLPKAAIKEQNKTGWQNFPKGRISTKWGAAQQMHCSARMQQDCTTTKET